MRRRRNAIAASSVVFAVMLAGTHVAAEEPQLDPLTGLKMAGDWEVVRNNCIACHSPKLITQQSGSKAQWLKIIRWMQEKQNLWQFDPATEEKIIGYLADNYPPQENGRRAQIPPDLMPPNPYASATVDSK